MVKAYMVPACSRAVLIVLNAQPTEGSRHNDLSNPWEQHRHHEHSGPVLACREARHDVVHVHHSLAGHLGHAVQCSVHLVVNDGPELQADAALLCMFMLQIRSQPAPAAMQSAAL